MRTLIDRIELVSEDSDLQIVLRGDLAAILRFATNSKNPDVLSEIGVFNDLLSQETLVAGARNIRFLRLVGCQISKLAT